MYFLISLISQSVKSKPYLPTVSLPHNALPESDALNYNKSIYTNSGSPACAKCAWNRAPYSWNMVRLFSFGCHVIDIRTYASTDCTGGVGETIKRKGGVSQACLSKATSFIYEVHNMVN